MSKLQEFASSIQSGCSPENLRLFSCLRVKHRFMEDCWQIHLGEDGSAVVSLLWVEGHFSHTRSTSCHCFLRTYKPSQPKPGGSPRPLFPKAICTCACAMSSALYTRTSLCGFISVPGTTGR